MSAPTPAPRPTAPVAGAQDYFNSSRLKVIGLITAATVAVGALGGIAGVAFDPDPVSVQPRLEPGSGTGVGSAGQSAPRVAAHAQAPTVRGFAAAGGGAVRDDTGDSSDGPSSVGSVSPGTGGGFSSSPSAEPSDGGDEPTPDPGTSGGGSAQTMAATDVDVFVPDGWEVTFSDDQNVGQTNGSGSYSFAFTTTLDPSVAASDVIAQNLDVFLPPESYTQRQTSDVVPLQPFGSVVSVAALGYEALWVDNQGSMSVHGEMYVGIRQDGTLLVVLIEHLPAEDFESSYEEMAPIVDNTFNRFAGLG
ncbi:hypothetical protein G5V58_18845 [Nocardioides anomalus]|uniref:Uncharacterized protein n=1 Tax=Nocardioides anomalus TaxID=2712223 RepID=A0A6G6WH82_9ACTN|nr:hypothetical protein [Nocardioides anomalus]QIG44566.1 hypothetical protein G5V58_18845 [Nocardioides anomalus]